LDSLRRYQVISALMQNILQLALATIAISAIGAGDCAAQMRFDTVLVKSLQRVERENSLVRIQTSEATHEGRLHWVNDSTVNVGLTPVGLAAVS
jgi:hypothetical protein